MVVGRKRPCNRCDYDLSAVSAQQRKRLKRHFGMACPRCAQADLSLPDYLVYDRRRVDKSTAVSIAFFFGGTLCSRTVTSSEQLLRWRCGRNHVFDCPLSRIKHFHRFCPTCSSASFGLACEITDYAASKSGRALGSAPYRRNRALWWLCCDGHRWRASLAALKRSDSWCPLCRVAHSTATRCLTRRYAGSRSVYTWKCSAGHRFRATLYACQASGCETCRPPEATRATGTRARSATGTTHSHNRHSARSPCVVCGSEPVAINAASTRKRMLKLFGTDCTSCLQSRGVPSYLFLRRGATDADAQEVAAFYGGECLTPKVDCATTKSEWICADGHVFKRALSQIKYRNSFCTRCRGYLGEEIVRSIFEKITGRPFLKRRDLPWLVSPAGSRLELDGYSEELKIGFEHQGRHHFDTTGFFSPAKYDHVKSELCAANGVALLQIPSVTEGLGSMRAIELVDEFCKAHGVQVSTCRILDILPFHTADSLAELKSWARDRGGLLLSSAYLGRNVEHVWQCANGHEFNARPANVRAGWWCRRCSTPSYTIDDLKQHAISKGGRCLSEKYTNANSDYEWICAAGHPWKASWNQVNNGGTWCRRCEAQARAVRKRGYSLDDLRGHAKKLGGKCLAVEYRNTHEPVQWECSLGHQWPASWHNVRRGGWCPDCQ